MISLESLALGQINKIDCEIEGGLVDSFGAPLDNSTVEIHIDATNTDYNWEQLQHTRFERQLEEVKKHWAVDEGEYVTRWFTCVHEADGEAKSKWAPPSMFSSKLTKNARGELYCTTNQLLFKAPLPAAPVASPSALPVPQSLLLSRRHQLPPENRTTTASSIPQ